MRFISFSGKSVWGRAGSACIFNTRNAAGAWRCQSCVSHHITCKRSWALNTSRIHNHTFHNPFRAMGSTPSKPEADNSTIDRLKRYSRPMGSTQRSPKALNGAIDRLDRYSRAIGSPEAYDASINRLRRYARADNLAAGFDNSTITAPFQVGYLRP